MVESVDMSYTLFSLFPFSQHIQARKEKGTVLHIVTINNEKTDEKLIAWLLYCSEKFMNEMISEQFSFLVQIIYYRLFTFYSIRLTFFSVLINSQLVFVNWLLYCRSYIVRFKSINWKLNSMRKSHKCTRNQMKKKCWSVIICSNLLMLLTLTMNKKKYYK